VRAYKGTYYTSYVSNSSAVTFPAPTNLTYSKENIYTIKLNWQQTSNGEDGFKIDKKVGAANWVVGYATVGENAVTWTDTSAEINQNLEYRVYAYKGNNSTTSVTTNAIDNTFPAPTNLTTTQISITSANITWNDNSTGEEKFEIERKLSADANFIKIGEVTGSATTTKAYTDTTLVPSSTYDYRVKGVYGTSSSAYISKTGYVNIFSAPTNLTATVESETSIKLTWTDNSVGEEGFKIDRKVGTEGTWVTNYTTLGSDLTSWTDEDTSPGSIFYYRISAYFSSYNSTYSNETAAIWTLMAIPIGSFSMGQDGVATPVHTVNITRPYYLGKFEVTQKEWQTIMGGVPSPAYGAGDNYPVYYISWYSTLVYCNKRSIAEGLSPCYTIDGSSNPDIWGSIPLSRSAVWDAVICDFNAKGYRLPTEAEWEYAARYNDNRTYPWGNSSPTSSLCNYASNVAASTEVGSYILGNNALEICDLAGNVSEWTWDWMDTYPSTSQTDPTGPSTTKFTRIQRGGGWSYPSGDIRSAVRSADDPFDISAGSSPSVYGFRVARTK
jgi:formylglycine-generating enzyme required for sulfatase activity